MMVHKKTVKAVSTVMVSRVKTPISSTRALMHVYTHLFSTHNKIENINHIQEELFRVIFESC